MNMNPPRKDMSFARVGKDLYLCGGCNYGNQKCYPQCFILDLQALKIAKINLVNSGLFTATQGATMSVRGGTMMYFGGCDRMVSCSNQMLIFSTGNPCPSNCNNNHGSCQANTLSSCLCNEASWWGNECQYPTVCKNDCSNYHGMCQAMDECHCFPGYIGQYCQTLVNCPANCTDIINGICLNNGNCKCNNFFKGQGCEIDIRIENPLNTTFTPKKKKKEETQALTIEKNPNVPTLVFSTNIEQKQQESAGEDATVSPAKVTSSLKKSQYNGFIVHRMQGSFSTPTASSSGQVSIQQSCPQNCSGHGICKNDKCYCEPGYTSTICNMSLKNNLQSGTRVKDLIVYFGGVFLLGFIFGSFGVRHFIQKSMKTEYYRKSELEQEAGGDA